MQSHVEIGGGFVSLVCKAVRYAPKRRRPWGLVTAVVVGLSTVLGLIANIGGARDAACRLEMAHTWCEANGLVVAAPKPIDPVAAAAQARAALLVAVNADADVDLFRTRIGAISAHQGDQRISGCRLQIFQHGALLQLWPIG